MPTWSAGCCARAEQDAAIDKPVRVPWDKDLLVLAAHFSRKIVTADLFLDRPGHRMMGRPRLNNRRA